MYMYMRDEERGGVKREREREREERRKEGERANTCNVYIHCTIYCTCTMSCKIWAQQAELPR